MLCSCARWGQQLVAAHLPGQPSGGGRHHSVIWPRTRPFRHTHNWSREPEPRLVELDDWTAVAASERLRDDDARLQVQVDGRWVALIVDL